MASNFETLERWKICDELKEYVRTEIFTRLPANEKYELYSQFRRASRSTTANIAEGWERYHTKDQIKFLIIAEGSVTEILDHTLEAKNWGYVEDKIVSAIRIKTDSCLKLINGYIRYLRNKDQ